MQEFILDHVHSFWFGLVAFIVFVFLVARFGIRPVVRAVEGREADMRSEQVAIDRTLQEVATLRDDLHRRWTGIDQRMNGILKEGRRRLGVERNRLLDAGLEDVAKHWERMLDELDAAWREAGEVSVPPEQRMGPRGGST